MVVDDCWMGELSINQRVGKGHLRVVNESIWVVHTSWSMSSWHRSWLYIYIYYYYYNIYIYIHNRSMSIYIGLHFLGRTFVAGKTGLQSGMIFHLLAFRHDKPWDALSKPHIEELRSHWGVAATFWGCKWKHTLLAKDCISSIQFFFGSIILSHTTHCHGLVLSANQQKSWGRF